MQGAARCVGDDALLPERVLSFSHFRTLVSVMLILSLLACSNVNDHLWGGGGTHYSTGEMYSPGGSDTGDDTGGADTGGTDTTDSGASGSLASVGSPYCGFVDDPRFGIVIMCSSQWAVGDIPAITGGTIYYNLMDSDGASLANMALDISETATSTDQAVVDGTMLTFFIGDLDESKTYIVSFYVETNDGGNSSTEGEYTVTPFSG